MKRRSFVLLAFFIADFIADAVIAGTDTRYFTKGLLMPLLLVFFLHEISTYSNANNRKYILVIGCALAFSFTGDIFLIGENSLHFILGIGAFLIAQVFYIVFFCSIAPFSKNNIVLLPAAALLITGYVAVLNYLFLPVVKQQDLVIPVLAYSIVLGLMLFTAVNMYTAASLRKTAIIYFIPGAVSFVASDSLIAFNRFYLAQPLPGFYIMLTYCLAQFLIVSGAIKIIKAQKPVLFK